MELQNIWEILKRRKGVIIPVFLLIFAVSLIGSFLILPTYESKAKILVGGSSDSLSSILSKIGLSGGGLQLTSDPSDKNMGTKESLAVTTQLLTDLALKLQLRSKSGDFYTPDDLLEKKLFKITPRPRVQVSEYDGTNMLEIRAESADPEGARIMAQTLADMYMAKNLLWISEEYETAGEFIDNQINKIRVRYLAALKAVEQYKVSAKTMDLKTETTFLFQKIEDLKKGERGNRIKKVALESSLLEVDRQLQKMKKYLKTSTDYKRNPTITRLNDNLTDLLIKREGTKVNFTGDHTSVLELDKQIVKVKELLKKELKKIFDKEVIKLNDNYSALVKQLVDKNIGLQEIIAQENIVSGYIDKYENRLLELPGKEYEQTKLQTEVTASGNLYNSLLDLQYKLEVAKGMTIADIKLIEPPVVIENPISPNKKLNVVLGFFLGTIFSFSLGFLVEYLDDTLKSPHDLKKYDFNLLGLIPNYKGNPVISGIDPNDPMYEAYRSVVSGITFSTQDDRLRKLLITSVGPKEGKSTMVVNLGILYAREGKKVLLVDTDFRRPELHRFFELENESGFVDLLFGRAAAETVIHKTGIKGLKVISSGIAPPDVGRLLKPGKLKKMEDILNLLTEKYDLLIFDSAPLSIKNDPVLLMSRMDEMLILAKRDLTTFKDIHRVREILRHAGITPLGIILQ